MTVSNGVLTASGMSGDGTNARLTVAGNVTAGNTGTGTGKLWVRKGALVTVANTIDLQTGGTLQMEDGQLVTGAITRSTGLGVVNFLNGSISITNSDLALE